MNQISHILVLSQPEFVQRQVGAQLSDPRPRARRTISEWLGFTRRNAPAA